MNREGARMSSSLTLVARLYLGDNAYLEVTSRTGASDLQVSLEGSTNHQLTIRPASSRCISIEVGK